MAEAAKTPNVEAQRTAMKKLEFLVGEWSGDATVLRGAYMDPARLQESRSSVLRKTASIYPASKLRVVTLGP